MAERSKHLFEFAAEDIAKAAKAEAEYHRARIMYWEKEQEISAQKVKETASVKLTKESVTGGSVYRVYADYGDLAAYNRLNVATQKIGSHQADLEKFESAEKLYGTQGGRMYKLDAEDVVHFRLNGKPREE